MYVKSGSYTGNGTSQSVTGLGFQPKFVLVQGGANIAVFTIDVMGANATAPIAGTPTPASGKITSINSDGFSVGSNASVNSNGVTYYWLVLADDGGTDLETGSYAGNGSDNRNITLNTLTGTPDLVIVSCATSAGLGARLRTSVMGTDAGGASSQRFDGNVAANHIQSFSSGSFQVGTGVDVNTGTGTPTYYWIALKSTTNKFSVFTYTGNGLDNDTKTGAGFQPDNVWTKHGSSTNGAICRYKDEVGDLSFPMNTGTAGADRIQAFASDGFQAGTNASVNGNTIVYYAVAFKDTVAPAHAAIPVFMNQYRQRWN